MIKSITDEYCGIHFIIRSWVLDLKLNSLFYSTSKEIMICFIIFSRYFGFVAQLISKITECFICFDRFIILEPSRTNSNRKISKIIYLLLIIYSFLFYTYKFFQNRVVPITKITPNMTFFTVETDSNRVFKLIDFFHSFIKDFSCLLISFIFNFLNLHTILNLSKMDLDELNDVLFNKMYEYLTNIISEPRNKKIDIINEN